MSIFHTLYFIFHPHLFNTGQRSSCFLSSLSRIIFLLNLVSSSLVWTNNEQDAELKLLHWKYKKYVHTLLFFSPCTPFVLVVELPPSSTPPLHINNMFSFSHFSLPPPPLPSSFSTGIPLFPYVIRTCNIHIWTSQQRRPGRIWHKPTSPFLHCPSLNTKTPLFSQLDGHSRGRKTAFLSALTSSQRNGDSKHSLL